jgi:hypothetical protein
MSLNITKGKRQTPIRGIIMGTSGIGKSTFAAGLPKPLFLDTEESTNELDVDRITITDWQHLLDTIRQVANSTLTYQTIVIDTADWAERMLIENLLKKNGKKSIEDYSFGKGYTIAAEEFGRFLTATDALTAKGMHVVFIAHTKVVRVSPPDQTDGYDRYELKMSKQSAPLLKEWSDLLIFAHNQVTIVEGTDGRVKAQGGKERVMHTTSSAAWDAKNRFGLPEVMPFDASLLLPMFSGRIKPVAESAPVVVPPAAEEQPEPAAPANITAEQCERLEQYVAVPICAPIISRALAHYNCMERSDLTEEQAAKIISRCQEEMNKEPAKPAPAAPASDGPRALFLPATLAWLTANEAAVNTFLIAKNWAKSGQTFRDLSPDRAESIITKADAFAKAASIPTLN